MALCYKEFKCSVRRKCHMQTFWRCYIRRCKNVFTSHPARTELYISTETSPESSCLQSVRTGAALGSQLQPREERLSGLHRLLCHRVCLLHYTPTRPAKKMWCPAEKRDVTQSGEWRHRRTGGGFHSQWSERFIRAASKMMPGTQAETEQWQRRLSAALQPVSELFFSLWNKTELGY